MIAVGPVTGTLLHTDAPEGIPLVDIAHCLSQLCRWHGSTVDFYSVAQHCVIGSRMFQDEELAKHFLLHESGEAVVADIPSPLRSAGFTRLEDRVLRKVLEHHGLGWPQPSEIKEMDKRMAATEAKQLLHHDAARLLGFRQKPLQIEISPWAPRRARKAFLARARELGLS